MRKDRYTCGWSLVTALFVSLASGAAWAADNEQQHLLRLARDGNNAEAVAVYERLKDRENVPVDVMRAAAGCYWRERRFEEARQLYGKVLERQPNMRTLGEKQEDKTVPAGDETAGNGSQAVAVDGVVVQSSPDAPVAVAAAPVPSRPVDDRDEAMLRKEIDTLKEAYLELASGRDELRRQTDERIAELSATAATRSAEMDAMRQQLSRADGKIQQAESMTLDARRQLQAQATSLNSLIEQLGRDVAAARRANETLRTAADTKINDLLDAITTEKIRNATSDREMKRMAAELEAQRAAAPGETGDLKRRMEEAEARLSEKASLNEQEEAARAAREAELRARLEESTAAKEAARLKVVALEQALEQMREQFNDVSVRLSARDLELTNQLARLEGFSNELELQEIERMENEYAALEVSSSVRMSLLQGQIERLESNAGGAAAVLAATERERDAERVQRMELEQAQAEQAEELSEVKAMLVAATAELARQYDAIREQVKTGMTMRLPDDDASGVPDAGKTRSPELMPLIGQLEEATGKASAEVQQLRTQLEQERAAFAMAALENDRARAAMTAAHELRAAGLKGEIDRLVSALAARDRIIEMLEADLDTERASTERVLVMARESDAVLSERIRSLEAAIALQGAQVAATAVEAPQPSVEAAEPPNVTDRGPVPVDLEAAFREIRDLLPQDSAGAIVRFEALPADAQLPEDILKSIGNLYREQKHYDKACRLFEKMIERHPDDLYAERKLVMTLFYMGLYEQALDRMAGAESFRKTDE